MLEENYAFCDGSLLDAVRYAHAACWNIAKHIPPLSVVGERRVCHTSDETGDFEEIIDFSEISIRESVSGESS